MKYAVCIYINYERPLWSWQRHWYKKCAPQYAPLLYVYKHIYIYIYLHIPLTPLNPLLNRYART